jgi:hypothetical protein
LIVNAFDIESSSTSSEPLRHIQNDENNEYIQSHNINFINNGDDSTTVTSNEPIHIVEAKLLHLITQYTIPLHTYGKFMSWEKLCQTTSFEFNTTSNFANTIKKLTTHKSMSHNIPLLAEIKVDNLPAVFVRKFSFLQNIKHLCKSKTLMKSSVWRYNQNNTTYSEINTGSWWLNAEQALFSRLTYFDIHDHSQHQHVGFDNNRYDVHQN